MTFDQVPPETVLEWFKDAWPNDAPWPNEDECRTIANAVSTVRIAERNKLSQRPPPPKAASLAWKFLKALDTPGVRAMTAGRGGGDELELAERALKRLLQLWKLTPSNPAKFLYDMTRWLAWKDRKVSINKNPNQPMSYSSITP
jgi:hypothetical protein